MKKKGELFTNLMADFVAGLEARGYSENTLIVYRSDLRHLWRWLVEVKGLEQLSDIGRSELVEYSQSLLLPNHGQKKGGDFIWTASTRNRHLVTVRCFFKYLVKCGALLSNPASELEGFRPQKKLPKVPGPREVLKLLAAVDINDILGLRNRCIMELMYSCGIRISELMKLNLGDLDFSQHTIHVRCGKYGRDRMLPLLSEVEKLILSYLKVSRPRCRPGDNQALFLSTRGNRIGKDSILKAFRRYSQKAKLKQAVTPHTLRHCCATHLLKENVSLRHIQALLGHRSLATTQIYTKVDISGLQDVVRRHHPREKF